MALSKPPRARNRSARTSMQADGRTNTSRDRVVLLLVELARFGDRVDLAEAVEAQPDVLEDPAIVPRHELRSDEAGVRAVQLLDQGADGVRIEGDVVVADAEEPVVALDEREHLVGGDAEAGVGAERAHERIGQVLGDQGGEVVAVGVDGVAGDEEEGVEVRVVLVDEGLERLLEPGARTVDDDDRDDRRARSGRRSPRWREAIAARRSVPVTRLSHGTSDARHPPSRRVAWPVPRPGSPDNVSASCPHR